MKRCCVMAVERRVTASLSWEASTDVLEALSVLQYDAPPLVFQAADQNPPKSPTATVEHPPPNQCGDNVQDLTLEMALGEQSFATAPFKLN
jgi:hypothetical protein